MLVSMKMLVLFNLLQNGKMHKSSIRDGLFKLRFTADHKHPCLTKWVFRHLLFLGGWDVCAHMKQGLHMLGKLCQVGLCWQNSSCSAYLGEQWDCQSRSALSGLNILFLKFYFIFFPWPGLQSLWARVRWAAPNVSPPVSSRPEFLLLQLHESWMSWWHLSLTSRYPVMTAQCFILSLPTPVSLAC